MSAPVAMQLMKLAGGDVFLHLAQESQEHQQKHGCGLHHAGGPQLQLVAALARATGASRVLDLGSGLGYSTLWIANAIGDDATVPGIDHDPVRESGRTVCVRTAGRDADAGEAIDPEPIGDEEQIVDRIVDRAAGPRIGESVTRPVDTDDAQPRAGCWTIESLRLESAGRTPVTPQHRRPLRIPELGGTDGSSRSRVEP